MKKCCGPRDVFRRSPIAFIIESVRLRRASLMTDKYSDGSSPRAITSEEAFDAAISEVVMTALENGVDPEGSWVCRNGDSAPDMEVIITELIDGAE